MRAKIARARAHIAELEQEVVAYHERQPYIVVLEDGPETGLRVAKVGGIRESIPDRLPLLAGDAVHNLRGALDHLAYHLSPGDDTAFPVWRKARTPTSREVSALVSGKVRRVDAAVRQVIVDAQPYLGGAGQALWVVSYLDNVDKHRLLLAVGAAHSSLNFDAAGFVRQSAAADPDYPFRPEEIPVMMLAVRPIERYPVVAGTELFTASPEQFDAMSPTYTFDVALGEPDAVRGEPVVPVLSGLADHVEGVVNTIEAVL